MNTRKLGKARMSQPFVDLAICEGLNPCDRFIPLHVESDWSRDELTIVGYHPDFEEISEGEMIPEYHGTFVDGRRSPHWQRVV